MNLSKNLAVVALLALLAAATNATAAIVDVTVGPGGNFVFEPVDVVVQVGDTVRWTWDSPDHNVGSGLPGAPTPYFLSGPPAPAGTMFEFVFDQAFLDANPEPGNVYDYHCHPHGDFGMVGSVTVNVGAPVPTVSGWGVIVMSVVLASCAAYVVRQRRSEQPVGS